MKRVETVLGTHWQELPQGKKLKQIGDNFRQTLATRQAMYLTDWQDHVRNIDAVREKEKNVFNIEMKSDRYNFYLDFNEYLLYLP